MPFNYEIRDEIHRKPERKLYLRPKDGGSANYAHATGFVDPRLFKDDGSHILAVHDTQSNLWSLRYPHGVLPKQLTQRFTSFNQLLKYTKDYYAKRNVEIWKIED